MRLALLCALALAGCTNDVDSRRALESSGFTEIRLTGWSPFACSDDDAFETGFRAKNPRGIFVTGTVCCGWLTKGCTVRF